MSKQTDEVDTVQLRNQLSPKPVPNYTDLFGPTREKVKKTKGINKLDIGTPSNFTHVAHVGFNKDTGFDTHGEGDVLNQVLKKAGVLDLYVS